MMGRFTILVSLMLTMHCGRSNQQHAPWYTALPDCPCQNPDAHGVKLDDGWAIDNGDIGHYHPGASVCYRSYPAVKTTEGKSGQQCCYNNKNRLIKVGSGAGTPDKVSTCAGEYTNGRMMLRKAGVLGHYWKDVRPWQTLGTPVTAWQKYNQYWIPNLGKHCDSLP